MRQDKIRVIRKERTSYATSEELELKYNFMIYIILAQPIKEPCTLSVRVYDTNMKLWGTETTQLTECPVGEVEFNVWSKTKWDDGTYYIHLYQDEEPIRRAEMELEAIRTGFTEDTLEWFDTGGGNWEYEFARVLALKPWWMCMSWETARYTYMGRHNIILSFLYDGKWVGKDRMLKDQKEHMPHFLVTGRPEECKPITTALMGRNKTDRMVTEGLLWHFYRLDEILRPKDKAKLWEDIRGMHTVVIRMDENGGLLPCTDAIRDWHDFLKNVATNKEYRFTSFVFTARRKTWIQWTSPVETLIEKLDLTNFCLTEDPVHNPDSNIIPTKEDLEEAKVWDCTHSAQKKLDQLVGLTQVKEEVTLARTMALFFRRREELGIGSQPDHRYHMLFLGNPGTGKTTVAQLIGEMYHEMGLLSHGRVKTVGRSDLVGEYIGQTEAKMGEIIKDARGGVLFIDEAYALADGEGGRSRDYGKEVIHALLPVLSEPDPDLIVVMAGYEDKMKMLLEMNQGLRDRFPLALHFQDFTDAELLEMAVRLCAQKGFVLTDGAMEALREVIARATAHRNEHFGNGRWLHDLMEQGVWKAMAMRVMACTDKSNEHALFSMVERQDVLAAEKTWAHADCERLVEHRPMGFRANAY
jgi:stage V sporulation protein K